MAQANMLARISFWELLDQFGAGMPDVLGFAEIDDFLSDVGGVVSDAFEAAGGDHQVEAAGNNFAVVHHVFGQFLGDFFC